MTYLPSKGFKLALRMLREIKVQQPMESSIIHQFSHSRKLPMVERIQHCGSAAISALGISHRVQLVYHVQAWRRSMVRMDAAELPTILGRYAYQQNLLLYVLDW